MLPIFGLLALAAAPPLSGPAVCTFPSSRLGPSFNVHVAGTSFPLGSVGAWGGDPRMEASLGLERGRPVLRATIAGGGVAITGDIFVEEETVLSPVRAVSGGPLTLAPDAIVRVTGFDGRRVRLATPTWAMVQPVGPLAVTAACEDLHVALYLPNDYSDQVAALAGVPDGEEVRVRARAALRDAPGGRKVARVNLDRGATAARALGRADGAVEVAVLEWSGAIWRGWVRERDLAPPPGDGELSSVFGALGGLGMREDPPRHACPTPQPLSVPSPDGPLPVGAVDAGTPFEVVGAGPGGTVAIRLPDRWLSAAEDGALLLPETAAGCPAVGAP